VGRYLLEKVDYRLVVDILLFLLLVCCWIMLLNLICSWCGRFRWCLDFIR